VSAIAVCCVAIAVSACAHPGAKTKPPSDNAADTLIVSVDDVRRIVGDNQLVSQPGLDVRQPSRQDPGPDPQPPCRAVLGGEAMFGSGWRQFRSVEYSGLTMPTISGLPGGAMYAGVTQAVGIYPDEGAARTAFDRLVPALTACSDLHARYYMFTVNEQDPSTAALDYFEKYRSKIYRVKSSALIYVGVMGFPQAERITRTVLQTITDRIQ
jgi:hypothetical protein